MKSRGEFVQLFKFSLLKFIGDGADRVLKTPKSQKITANDQVPCHIYEENASEDCGENNDSISSYPLFQSNSENPTNFSSRSYYGFQLNFLSLLASLAIKLIGFQVGIVVQFFTFPIWLSYFWFMVLMFPFQTLWLIKARLIDNLFRIWRSSLISVASFLSIVTKVFVWSLFVSFVLLGLLVSGFLIGSFTTRRVVEEPILRSEILNFDYTKTSPVAFVPITSSGICCGKENVEGGKCEGAKGIPNDHTLKLTVSLTMPESDYNRNLGVFQVRVDLLSSNGRTTSSLSHPGMLRFKSKPIHYVETFLKSAFIIAGFHSQSQSLKIKMRNSANGNEPISCLKVIIEQRAKYGPGAGIPEIYSASLDIESDLPPYKNIIWSWRRIIFIMASITSFFIELIIVFIISIRIIIRKWR